MQCRDSRVISSPAAGIAAKVQSLIVNKASAAEGSPNLLSLRIRGEESIFEGLLDYHGDILQYISRPCT